MTADCTPGPKAFSAAIKGHGARLAWEENMQRKWLVASLLILAELAVLGGMIVASRNGLSWGSVFGLRIGDFARVSADSDDNQSFSVSGPATLDLSSQAGAITVTGGTGSQI